MNSKKISHIILAVALTCSLAFSTPINVLAGTGFRRASAGGAQIDFSGGAVLETQDFSTGTAAFVNSNAIKSAMGTSALHQYFMSDNWLPGISSYPLGANATASALQYNGTGFDKRNAKTGQYSSTTDSWSQPDYTDGKYFLTYRFAGLAMVSDISMEKVTNPKFISDSVFASASNPENNTTVNQGTVYSADGLEVKQSTPVTTYGKGGRIPPFDGNTYFYSTGASGWLGTVPASANLTKNRKSLYKNC